MTNAAGEGEGNARDSSPDSNGSDAAALIEITNALTSSLDFREILQTVVKRTAEVVRVDRVSLVMSPEKEGTVGYVVVASDDASIANLPIELDKYPEIQQALRTREPVTIHDANTHPLLEGVRGDVPSDHLGTMTLVPIVWEELASGVLFLRSQAKRGSLSERELGFCRIIANTTAIALRNARVMQSLRDHTQQATFARFEAERRLQSFKRYADLFASSPEGIAVVDRAGRLVFANPRSYDMLGYNEGDFAGALLAEVIHPDDREEAKDVVAGFSRGEFPKERDLRVVRGDGRVVTCSISCSALLDGDGAVLLSFRDVTQHRRTERELVRTKIFLERLIAASVDGIVAADLKGNVILYNHGAERIHSRRADDVIGKVNVRDLYPPGTAAEVMALIRSSAHGGPGRLESTRLEALASDGQRVPISLSAAVIYDERGNETATFGIFTDLRERIHVEERLAQAQEKLAMSEKQALLAELAGTAAHELNQPLTTVMAYAELLQRKLNAEQPEHKAAARIVA
ncbi:MAG: PAS domain S-box protein, partial [Myxococcales bacterium]|nr:PAS domain S-box protein [Myxococcales bacterium]